MSASTAIRLSKVCCTCRVEKVLEEFNRDRTRSDGRYGQCRMCASATKKAEYRANPQKANDRARQWRQANPDRSTRKAIEWSRRNPERRKAIANKYAANKYRENIELSRAKGRASERRKWATDYDGMILKARNSRAVRRSRQRLAKVERVSYRRIMMRDRMRCHICKKRVRKADLQFDHVIPLARGGAHSEKNIAVAHKKCNLSKNANVLTLF